MTSRRKGPPWASRPGPPAAGPRSPGGVAGRLPQLFPSRAGLVGKLSELLPAIADYYGQLRTSYLAGRTRRELDQIKESLCASFRWDADTDHFPKLAFRADDLLAVLAVWPSDPDLASFRVNLAYTNPFTGTSHQPFPTTEIYSANLAGTVLSPRGLVRLPLDDSVIDSAFIVLTDQAGIARQILDRRARQTILDLHYQLPLHTLYAGLAFERVLVKKVFPADSLTAPALGRFHDGALALVRGFLRHLVVEEAAAIELVSIVAPEQAPRCKVCGERVILDRIDCRRCETPHHRDCWEYNGRCAVYACGETRFDTPEGAPVTA